MGSIRPFVHAPGDDGALEQIAAELGEDAPDADLADAVAGAADALQAAGDGLGRLDLQDEVDGAHVDAELERAGGHEAGQLPPAFSSSSTLVRSSRASEPWWARAISPVSPPSSPWGELVETQGDPLGGAAVVDEHDRGGVLAHEPQQLGVDGGPDRVAGGLAAGHRLERVVLG